MRKLLTLLVLTVLLATPALADRDISGSYVTVDPVEAETGIVELCFYAWNNSSTFEWITDVTITLPTCMTILADPPATATPEEGFNFNAEPIFTGYGTNVGNWHGEDDYGYGFLFGLMGGYFCMTVQIDCECDIIYNIHWELQGDGYGDEPHFVEGDLDFTVLCSTPTEDGTWSDVKALY